MYGYCRKKLFADETCVKCKQCVNSCPMGNIHFENNKPQFGKKCCACMRCYNLCPVGAIQLTKRTRNKTKFLRYKGFDKFKSPKLYGQQT